MTVKRITSDECIDGGVSCNCHGVDSPKKIKSTELIRFHCVFSLLALAETSLLGDRVYTLDAALENGVVKGSLDWYCNGEGEKTTFEADPSFMIKLQEIVAKYDLAQHNGYTHIVSGLPDMYGSKLDIRYDSGECIYAHDNEDCFLPMEMMEESAKLFGGFCGNG